MRTYTVVLLLNAALLAHGLSLLDEAKLEALSPKGLRVTLPDVDKLQFFAFHGRKNKPLDIVEPGDFSGEISEPKNGFWEFLDKDLQLQPGDVVHYWLYVQYNRLGYRKDKQQWTVTELVPFDDKPCQQSLTEVAGSRSCQGSAVLNDEFKSVVNSRLWTVEQYIPTNSRRSQDFEFGAYVNREANVFVKNEVLYLKPTMPYNSIGDLRGTLDLSDGCTSNDTADCIYEHQGAFYIPPVTSGKVRSKISFKYGIVEIKAKLPRGDWIYPILRLVSTTDPTKTIWVAYARGNDHLTGNDGSDIGSKLLFGGPTLRPDEPNRSKQLRSYLTKSRPFTTDLHTYKCQWEKGKITLHVDNVNYGTVLTDQFPEFDESEFYLTLGVGVGGINDFPEGFKSVKDDKPWRNKGRTSIKNFFDAKDKWMATWIGDDCALQVDSVKITAL